MNQGAKTVFILMLITFSVAFLGNGGEPSTNSPTTDTITQPTTVSNNKIKVASFNIQVFGKTKSDKPDVMDTLAKIARDFDIIAIQEIRDASFSYLNLR